MFWIKICFLRFQFRTLKKQFYTLKQFYVLKKKVLHFSSQFFLLSSQFFFSSSQLELFSAAKVCISADKYILIYVIFFSLNTKTQKIPIFYTFLEVFICILSKKTVKLFINIEFIDLYQNLTIGLSRLFGGLFRFRNLRSLGLSRKLATMTRKFVSEN